MDAAQTVTRQELFDLLWQVPMTQLSQRWGLKPKDLIVICDEYQIPRPPNGHWAQVNWGTASPKPNLPSLDVDDLIELQKFRAEFNRPRPTPKKNQNLECRLAESHAPQQIVAHEEESESIVRVLERLSSSPHPIIKKLKAKPDTPQRKATEYSDWQVREKELTVSVSKKQRDRALRILDAIYKAWEDLGNTTCVTDGALLDGEDAVTFSLTELYRRVDARKPGQSWASWQYVETGQLMLEITSRQFDNMRRKWCDGKIQKLEKVLDSFIETVPGYMSALRLDRLDRECEKRQEAKAKERQTALENEAARQKQLIEELQEAANHWAEAKQIREYLAALAARIDSGEARARNPEAFTAWLDWAKWYADELCPLTFSRQRPGTPDQPTNTPLAELDLTSQTREQLIGIAAVDTDQLFQLSKNEISEQVPSRHWGFYRELIRVMQGLGYDLSGKDWNKYG